MPPPPTLQVPEGTAPDALAREVVGRAAAKVQRLLQYRSLPGGASRQPSSSSASTVVGSSGGRGRPEQGAGGGAEAGADSEEQTAGLLLERRLLGEVEAARERCKRAVILARLQAELPSCLVGVGWRACVRSCAALVWWFALPAGSRALNFLLTTGCPASTPAALRLALSQCRPLPSPAMQALCLAPGDTVGFEWLFTNSSGSAAEFEVDWVQGGSGGGSCSGSGGGAEAGLSLVAGESEWRALEPAARLAGGLAGKGRAGCVTRDLMQRYGVAQLLPCPCSPCI